MKLRSLDKRLLWTGLGLSVSLAACATPREEDTPIAEMTASGPAEHELQGCGCPAPAPDLGADCDAASLLAAFSTCDDEYGLDQPCPLIRSGCDGEPTDPAALDCVLEHAAADEPFIYTVQRDACDDAGPYIVVVRAGGVAPVLGLECYGSQGSQVPFEAMYSAPDAFEMCLESPDPAARLACLQTRLGFAEPERTHCP